MYYDHHNSRKFYCGLSFATNPTMNPEVNYQNEINNNMNLTYNGANYYSINDIPGTLSNVVVSDSQVLTTGNCPGDKLFMWSGNIKICVDSCPTDRRFRRIFGDNKECYYGCPHGQTALKDTPRTCFVGTCISNSYQNYGDTNFCVDGCKDYYPYLSGNDCLRKCPSFLEITPNQYPPNETGRCQDSCNLYQYENPAYKYSDGTLKKYCLNQCPNYLKPTNDNPNSTTGECVSFCSTFVLEDSNFRYSSGAIKKFCLTDCSSANRNYFWNNGTHKRCIEACPSTSQTIPNDDAFRYLDSSTNECLTKCPSTNYVSQVTNFNYLDETGICTSTCSSSDGFRINYPNLAYSDASLKQYCVPNCSNTSPYSIVHTETSYKLCVKSCLHSPEISSIITRKPYEDQTTQECVEFCTPKYHDPSDQSTILTNTSQGYCKPDCGTEFYQKQPLTLDHIYCVDSCLDNQPFYHLKDPNKKTCYPTCPSDTYFNVTMPDRPYSVEEIFSTQPDFACVSDCSLFKFSDPTLQADYCSGSDDICHSDSSNQFCLSHCPTEYYLERRSDDNKTCLDRCDTSDQWKFSSPVFTCVTDCTEVNCSFVDEVDSGFFCKYDCPVERKYFRRKTDYSKCVDSCLNTEFLLVNQDRAPFESLPSLDSGGECVSKCSADYILETEFTFQSTNTPKTYCLPSCPATFYYYIDLNGEQDPVKKCIPECTEEPFIFFTPDLKCVESCLEEGFPYYNEDYSCTDTCNSFINNQVECVKECPENKPFVDNQHCVASCPSARRFVENYSKCVETCPDKYDGMFCVSTCNEALLVKWFSDREELFISKPFTGKSRECREACDEPAVEHIHSATLDCLVECPAQGHRYVDSKKVCRASCEDKEFPYTDEETAECLSECKPARPFLIPEKSECVEKCPSYLEFSLNRRVCGNNVCEENCDQTRLECIVSCPDKMKFRLEKEDTVECLCACPQGYSSDKDGVCKFECLLELGYTKENNICYHCLNDRNMVLEGTRCVNECSRGKIANAIGICVSCLTLDLWEDERGRCKPMHLCDPLSQFDFTLKRCFKCSGNELKLIVRENQAPICQTSACSKGNIELEDDLAFCFECDPGRFYYQRACYTFCPGNTDYDLIKMRCIVSCMTACSTGCCLGGICEEDICRCKSAVVGSRCDVVLPSASWMIDSIVDMLNTRIKSRLLQLNESHLIGEMALILEGNSLRLLNEVDSSRLFVTNTLSKLKQLFVQGSFQLRLFQTLDFLLGLAVTIDTTLQKSSLASEVLNLVDTFSDMVVELSNTAVDHSMQGKYFSLTFGHNVSRQNAVNIQECLEELDISNWLFPYKKIEFSPATSAQITRTVPEALIINSNPLSEFYTYAPSGKIDLNTVCSPKTIDTGFPPQLDSNQKTLTEQFKSTAFNIFNPSDPFFNDRCVVYDFEGKDITLDERKKMLVDPKNLCAENPYQVCEATQTENGVECVCKGIRSKPKSAFESVTSSYPENNYILFTCLAVFKKADFLSNTGFYMVGVPFLLGIALSFYYSTKINTDLESDTKFNYLRQDSTLFKPASMSKYVYFNECLDLANRLEEISLIQGTVYNVNIKDILPTIGDLRHLTAEEMLLFDKRSHFQFAVDSYVQLHPTLKVFFKSNLRSTPTFDIMMFVTETNLTSTMSAFFINDKMVQRKNIEGDPSLLDSLSKELVQTVWAVTTSILIVTMVKSFLKVDQFRQRNVAFTMVSDKKGNARRVYDRYVTNHRLKMMLFLWLSICLNMVFTYFTVIYSELYSNSQSIWLNGIIIGLIMKHGILRAVCPFLLVISRILVSIFPATFIFFKGCLALTNLLVPSE